MKFYTENKHNGKSIFVAGTPKKFNMVCNFKITKEIDFCNAIEKEFPSMNSICFYNDDEMKSDVLFLDETRDAAEIMDTIIKLFGEYVQ